MKNIRVFLCVDRIINFPPIFPEIIKKKKQMQKQSTWYCLTGDGHGDVLADDKLFSISSGKSTDPVRILRVALRSFLFADGLDGAFNETSTVNKSLFNKLKS